MEFVVPSLSDWFTVVMGVGTVFIGLICIVIICSIMSLFFRQRKPKAEAAAVTPAAPAPAVIENRQEIIAAVTAAVAEEMGTDVSALRVVSFKKV